MGTVATARLGGGTANSTTYLRGDQTWATVAAGTSFDLHDDVGSGAVIADADRILFSDEGTTDDPMRYTTASLFADYIQTEVELNADRVTVGTFATARIPNLSRQQNHHRHAWLQQTTDCSSKQGRHERGYDYGCEIQSWAWLSGGRGHWNIEWRCG